jgi:AraC-like DNA-binding protein
MEIMPRLLESPAVSILAGRCQELAGCLFDARRPELGRSLLELARDVPSRLPMAERLLIHSLIGRVFSRTASLTGIDQLPVVAAAFLRWAAADPTGDTLAAEALRLAACCAAALEPQDALARVAAVPDARTARALDMINRRYLEPAFGLKDVATDSGNSLSHAARMLKQHTGLGFMDHLHRRRVTVACRLLSETTLSIKQVSAAVGYGSSSQFGRHFKRLTGVTAHEFRIQRATSAI